MATEGDGLTQGRDEHFTVGTASQMSANFVANVSCELIIDIGRQLTENVQASALPVVMLMPSCRGPCPLCGSVALGHPVVLLAI
jgi:hypothetical protein